MAPTKIHGMCKTKEYRCWKALKGRCNNPDHAQYKDYGGRGIIVCERWLNFQNFFEDMGLCPEGYEIDRIDNNQGYSKENCRWATKIQNSRNRRSTKKHKVNNNTFVQQELIDKIGWSKHQFRWFLKKYGMSWILDGFKNNTLPNRTNLPVDKDSLLGKKIGHWLVLEFIQYKRSEGNRYLCRCDCGMEKEVVGYYLRSGKSTQCRKCSYKNQINKPNPKK